MPYDLHYEINEALANTVDAIQPVDLYVPDPKKMLTDGLARMAQPLPDGSPSPLSSRNILSAEAILLGNLLVQLQYFGHELNLFPDSLFLTYFRLLGLTRKQATSPLIQLQFTPTLSAIESGEPLFIEVGTKVRSKFFSDRYAIVIETSSIAEGGQTIEAIARIDQPGRLSTSVREQEFSLLPLSLNANFSAVTNTQIISQGQNQESVGELIDRTRTLLSRPGNRVVTARDYQEVANNVGLSETSIALPRLAISEDNSSVAPSDLVTIAVYPATTVETVRSALIELVPAGTRLDVVAGRVVPIDGELQVGVDPSLTEAEAFDLVATAIVDFVNPPNGNWSDRNFAVNLATSVERVKGIYSVKVVRLKHALTNISLENLQIQPHDLLEIQDSLTITYVF